MANAERTYVDPSALRSSYVHDDRSLRFCGWRRRIGGALPITRFGRAELVNAIQLAVHRGILSTADAQSALADLEADVREGNLILVDALWRHTLDLAADLSAQYTPALGTRALDVLHVATAVALEMTHFVSYDDRQLALARAVKLRVLTP